MCYLGDIWLFWFFFFDLCGWRENEWIVGAREEEGRFIEGLVVFRRGRGADVFICWGFLVRGE